MLIWTSFNISAITSRSNISRLLQKFHFPIDVATVFVEFDEIISFENNINRLCLLPKLFSKMYFLLYA